MSSSKRYIIFAVTLVPIVVFYGFSIGYSINVPWFDDIENIPYFLAQYLDAPSWYGKAAALLRPNNEHRVLSARLIVYLQYLFTHTINFRTLNLIGNLTVLGIFLVISRAYLKHKGLLYGLIPAAFFIFNLQFYSMTFMTIMSLQYQLIIFEVFLSFYLLTKPSKSAFVGAILVAIVGTYSMGNGVMGWPAGALFLLYLGQWNRLLVWIITGALAIVGYFSGYAFVQGNDEGFIYFFNHPFKVIIGFFAFTGGILDWFPRITFEKRMFLPVIGGITIVSFFIYYVLGALSISTRWQRIVPAFARKHYKQNTYFQQLSPQWAAFWVSCFVYLFINSALVVFFRTRFDYQLVLWATYKIYPGTLMAMTCLLSLQIFRWRLHSLLVIVFIGISLVSWASSYWHFMPQVTQDRKQRLAFALNQQRNGVGLGAEKKSAFAEFVVKTFERSKSHGFYQFPQPLISSQESRLEALFRDSTQLKAGVNVKTEMLSYGLEVYNDSFEFVNSKEEGVFVTLTSPTHFYVFSAEPLLPRSRTQKGFRINCPKGVIENDTYQVGLWVVQKNGNQLWNTQQSVTFP